MGQIVGELIVPACDQLLNLIDAVERLMTFRTLHDFFPHLRQDSPQAEWVKFWDQAFKVTHIERVSHDSTA